LPEASDGGPDGMVTDDSNGENFSILGEKEIGGSVRLSSWSPTMDLFVVTYEETHTMELFHMNLRKLWSISHDARPSSICWRPDGKCIAVGFENGKMALIDAETSDVVTLSTEHKSVVSLVYWHETDSWVSNHPAQLLLHPEAGESKFFILCSCDADLDLQISAFGSLPLCRINVKAHVAKTSPTLNMAAGDGEVIQVRPTALSADKGFISLALVYTLGTNGGAGAGANGDCELQACIIDVSPLFDRRMEIARWAHYTLVLERHVLSLKASAQSLRMPTSTLDNSFPSLERDGEDDAISTNSIRSAKLSKSLLLGYSSVVSKMSCQKSCKSSAAEVDKMLLKLYQLVTEDFEVGLNHMYRNLQDTSSGNGGNEISGGLCFGGDLHILADRVNRAMELGLMLKPKVLACARDAREYFSFVHSSQLAMDKDELPQSQVKAALASKCIAKRIMNPPSRPIHPDAGVCEKHAYLSWQGLRADLELFKEEIFSVIYDFSNFVKSPCKLLSKDVRVKATKTLVDLSSFSAGASAASSSSFSHVECLISKRADDKSDAKGGDQEDNSLWRLIAYQKSHPCAKFVTLDAASGESESLTINFTRGETVTGCGFYKWPCVVWLTHAPGLDEMGGTSSSLMSLMEVSKESVRALDEVEVCDDTRKCRTLSQYDPMSIEGVAEAWAKVIDVSKNRGTAFVQDRGLNLVVFDLEDD